MASVELFIARCGPEPLDVSLATAKRGFAFIDTNAFVQACYSRGSFRTWLIGEAVRLQAPAHWRLRTGVVLEPFETSRAAEPAPSGLLPITGINGVKWWQRLLLSLVIAVRPRKPACFGPLVAADVTSFPERYVQFASQLAREMLPASFDHGFSRLDAEAKRQTYRPGRIRALTVNMHDDRINILLAHAVRAGEHIVAVQHGGAYGTAALLASAPDLEYCHDQFITWGWTGQEDYRGRFVPLPSPLLARIAGAPRTPSQAIMFVGTLMLAFNPRFDYCADALEYRHWKRRFVTVLSTDAFANLRYRPYFPGIPWTMQLGCTGSFPVSRLQTAIFKQHCDHAGSS